MKKQQQQQPPMVKNMLRMGKINFLQKKLFG